MRERNDTGQEEEKKRMQATEQSFREIGFKRHMTVRIPRGLAEALEGFLRTDRAAKMGFDSKADLVTAAVRQVLTEYGYYRIPQREEEKSVS